MVSARDGILVSCSRACVAIPPLPVQHGRADQCRSSESAERLRARAINHRESKGCPFDCAAIARPVTDDESLDRCACGDSPYKPDSKRLRHGRTLRSSPGPHFGAAALAGSRLVEIGAPRSLDHNAHSIRTSNSVIDNAQLFDPYNPLEVFRRRSTASRGASDE